MKANHLFLRTMTIVALGTVPVKAVPTTYYVNWACTVEGTGKDRTCGGTDGAKKTIQGGMNAAQNGDTVIVLAGTYSGTNNRDLSFPVIASVTQWFTVKCERPAACTIDCQGSAEAGNDHRGFFVTNGATAAAVIDGFRIINGYVDSGSPASGGAIYVDRGEPIIQNCIIESNKATGGGGLFFADVKRSPNDNTPQIIGCIIRNNESLNSEGGGIKLSSHVDAEITSCQITGNTAELSGGGIYWDDGSDVHVIDSLIADNSTGASGGGVYAQAKNEDLGPDRSSWFKRCTFRRNEATAGPGGGIAMSLTGLWVDVVNSAFLGNVSASDGGGIYLSSGDPTFDRDVALVNSIFVGNTAANGGGLFVNNTWADARVLDCTFAYNVASTLGHSIRRVNAPAGSPDVELHNLIAWGSSSSEFSIDDTDEVDVKYSDIQSGWTPGTNGNISSNPLFITTPSPGTGGWGSSDDNYGDLRLTSSSPCLNVGSNSLLPDDDTDIDDDDVFSEDLPLDLDEYERVESTTVDMGAYERDACTTNANCDDTFPCTGVETCVQGNCITTVTDCNLNGVKDSCDINDGVSFDCDVDGIPDECDTLPVQIALTGAIPADESSFWRLAHNISRLTFACDILPPDAGDVTIQKLLSGGTYDSDLSSSFAITVENDINGKPRILRIAENTETLVIQTWYAVRHTGGWAGMGNFLVESVVQPGDANASKSVTYADLSWINANTCSSGCGEVNRGDIDFDLDVDTGATNSDQSAADVFIPLGTVSKPSGH